MWFLTGLVVGHRAGSGPLAARLGLMLLWLAPILLAKIAVANLGPEAKVPTILLAWIAMAACALYRPATSATKLALIDGAIGWARLVLLVSVALMLWSLHDVHFVILRAEGLPKGIAACAAAIAVEQGLGWWVHRDAAGRHLVLG